MKDVFCGPASAFARRGLLGRAAAYAIPAVAIVLDLDPRIVLVDGRIGCLTCHYAHGSSSAQTPAAGTTPEGPAGDSALLFSNNRGVCIACHQEVGSSGILTPTP